MLTLCCSTSTRCLIGSSPTEPVGALTVAATPEGLGACSIKAQEGDVLVEAASREQDAAPGLGKLPPALLPESNSKPTNTRLEYF